MSISMVEARKPEALGMVFKYFAKTPTDKFRPASKTKWGNVGRKRGVNQSKVDAHERCIESGQYKPEYYVPPVGEYNLELDTIDGVTGETRWTAHKNLGISHFYVAVVEWVDYAGMPAAYWRYVYMSNENSENSGEVAQEKRKPEDVVSITTAMIKCGIIDATEEAISQSLSDQGYQKKTAAHKNLMNDVKSEMGLGGVVVAIPKNLASESEKNLSDRDIDVHARVHNKTEAWHRDYHPRLLSEVLVPNLKPALNGSKVKTQKVKYYFNGMTPEEIKRVRPKLTTKDFLDHYYTTIAKPFCDLYDKKVFDDKLDIDFFNQIDGDNYS